MVRALFVILAISVIFFFFGYKPESNTVYVYENNIIRIGKNTFFVEIADNSISRSKGLSMRDKIEPNQGMLFVFDKPDIHGFWMKDMSFSIDILWVDENFVINHIEKNVSPETYPKVFYPPTTSLYVLELLSGSVDIFDIKKGDSIILEKNNTVF